MRKVGALLCLTVTDKKTQPNIKGITICGQDNSVSKDQLQYGHCKKLRDTENTLRKLHGKPPYVSKGHIEQRSEKSYLLM